MGTLADATIDIDREWLLYRKFIICEVDGSAWEATHEDFAKPGSAGWLVSIDSPTIWKSIDAVNAWHDSPSAGQVAKEG